MMSMNYLKRDLLRTRSLSGPARSQTRSRSKSKSRASRHRPLRAPNLASDKIATQLIHETIAPSEAAPPPHMPMPSEVCMSTPPPPRPVQVALPPPRPATRPCGATKDHTVIVEKRTTPADIVAAATANREQQRSPCKKKRHRRRSRHSRKRAAQVAAQAPVEEDFVEEQEAILVQDEAGDDDDASSHSIPGLVFNAAKTIGLQVVKKLVSNDRPARHRPQQRAAAAGVQPPTAQTTATQHESLIDVISSAIVDQLKHSVYAV